MFDAILGNDPVKAYLRSALQTDKLPHALLFAGSDGIGKSLFAKALAAHLLEDTSRVDAESHPDFHSIRPEGKVGLHSIETLRRLIDDVHTSPFEGKAKVFVIHEAHRMQPAAANALLKTLEEPSPDTVIVLLTSAFQEILPTIASRCSVLRFQPLSETEVAFVLETKGLPARFAKLAQGSPGRALDLNQRAGLEEKVFSLLAERHSYPLLAAALDEIEKAVENEDPLKEAQAVEHLFSLVLMWRRDQEARRFGVPLFFESAPEARRPLASLQEVEKAVDEARLAVSRNIRLSVCLEKMFRI